MNSCTETIAAILSGQNLEKPSACSTRFSRAPFQTLPKIVGVFGIFDRRWVLRFYTLSLQILLNHENGGRGRPKLTLCVP